MSRRRQLIIGAAVAGAAAAGALWLIQQRAARKRAAADWTDPEQPPEGTAGLAQAIGIRPTPAAAWAAARPGDPGLRGGSRLLRSYGGHLADDPESIVR